MIAKFGKFEYVLAEHYRFEEELGRGAMGIVYRAKDVKLGRTVAIKMLHPLLTNELGIARFQSEIRIAAGLHHPNIISVHESGEADGRLYFVMDYLGGESLRDLLKREKQLSPEDALRITEQVAEGLQYAHDHGVVHRDVKPENIILAEGRACVVDFGLARALGDVDAERLTASGMSVGTPHYLSPEQASAERDVGPKADQYALACVLYEMLVGEPPFTGPNARSILIRHMSEEPKPMRARRRTTPASVEAAVLRALEKVPADRFASVKEFVKGLRATASNVPVARVSSRLPNGNKRRLSRTMLMGILFAAVATIIGATLARSDSSAADMLDDGLRLLTSRTLDTTRIVVFPSTVVPGGTTDPVLDGRLRDALSRWTGITIVGESEIASALDGLPTEQLNVARRRAVTRSLRAGRYAMVEVTPLAGAQLVRVELLDAKGILPPRRASVTLPDGSAPDSIAHLAFSLLFDGPGSARNEDAAAGTRNRLAFASYLRGRAAASTWNLPYADSSYSAALRYDPSFPQALLALAQVRSWTRDDAPEVVGLLSRALDGAQGLSETAQLHASALRDFRLGRFHDACVKFESLTARDSIDFAAWLGLGECNRRDNAVIPNRASPSGRSFRGSLHRANVAIGRAFDLLPNIDSCCAGRADELLRRPLTTSTTKIVAGRGVSPDTAWYGAYPELIADTIAFVPLPIGNLTKAPPRTHPLAVELQRSAFLVIATKRAAQFPQSADALEELGEAMELRRNPAALDTIRRARAIADNQGQALRLAVIEVWLRVKVAIPGNLQELRAVRAFAESLLTHSSVASTRDAAHLASLAALVGDANRAATLSARVNPQGAQHDMEPEVPPEVRGSAWALLAYAALGGPVDSLRDLEARVTSEIANGVLPQQQAMVRSMSLGRAAGLAFPVYRAAAFPQLDTSVALIAAEAAWARGDKQVVRRLLANADRERVHMRAADLTLDAMYPEAWLLAQIGDTTAALRRIVPTLDALPVIPANAFVEIAMAGSVVQCMLLRAELLSRQGDRAGGQRWARAVLELTDTTIAAPRLARSSAFRLAR